MINPDLLADAADETAHVPTNEELGSIADLARKQQRLEKEVTDAETHLKRKQEELARVSELELPEALSAVGMSEFKLDDGYKVTVAKEYYANIPSEGSDKPEAQARRADAFKWLRDSGNDGLIKQEITVEAGRGEDALAQKTMDILREAGIYYSNTEAVHWQTLRAFVREQIERGTANFPREVFGVHEKMVASIKAPKKRKTA